MKDKSEAALFTRNPAELCLHAEFFKVTMLDKCITQRMMSFEQTLRHKASSLSEYKHIVTVVARLQDYQLL